MQWLSCTTTLTGEMDRRVGHPSTPMTSLRVLYVEDNDYLRDTISMLIECDEVLLTAVADAESAWARLQVEPFDVLVTDVNLPGESGLAMAQRACAANPRLWVLLCTGHDLSAGLATLGPTFRWVQKPFEPEDLQAQLQAIGSQVSGARGTQDAAV